MSNRVADELQYLYGLERFGIKLGLELMERLLGELGNPHRAFKSVHITGTNGKGSTASFIERGLYHAGFSVGLYTSPHLYRFNERVRVGGVELADEQLLEHIATVRATAARVGVQPTFFEFTTAIAFLEFARRAVDLAVVEVGMGGLLDATNVVTPAVAIITNVGLDHTPVIGATKPEIAVNKAGIIKPGCDVVTAETHPALLELFQKVCSGKGVRLYHVDQELHVKDRQASLTGQQFEVDGAFSGQLQIKLLGQHQVRNACTALLALLQLRERGWTITDEDIKQGLSQATWEGRLDIVSHQPFVLVDGAHNNDGIQSLATWLDETSLPHPSVLVVAAKQDKNIDALLSLIVPRFQHVVVTEGSYEPRSAVQLALEIGKHHARVDAIPNIAAAIVRARELQSSDGMMLVTGSLYMVGDALALLRKS